MKAEFVEQFAVKWVDGGREPTQSPNPAYPKGIDLDGSQGKTPACTVTLPYPAKRVGHYEVICHKCGIRIGCTTAGRPDDPRSMKVACKPIVMM